MSNQELVEKVAKIARLALSDEEKIAFGRDFEKILGAFEKIQSVDTSKVQPSFRPFEEKNRLREDVVGESLSQEEVLSLVELCEKGFIIGPRTVE